MKLNHIWLVLFVIVTGQQTFAQISNADQDSLYILEVEESDFPAKVLHAEPLYIDLIRDLGACRGEREWNIGFGLTDKLNFDSHEALIEYEWAPINRLGLELELPFTFYAPVKGISRDSVPAHRLNGLKTAAQWTVMANTDISTSIALGYIHEFKLADFRSLKNSGLTGHKYNTFLVIAKRWGSQFHSLIYTGPVIEKYFSSNHPHTVFEINTSFHYMISGTRNFIGIELNKSKDAVDFDMVIRPQMRISISEDTMVGIVVGIPVTRENERLSSFVRLIWEPGHHKNK